MPILGYSTSNVSQNLLDQSMAILCQCMASFFVFMLAGVVAVVTSLINVAAILQSKDMKSKFYALYVETGVVDCLMGSVYVATAVKKIYRYWSGVGDVMTRRQCCEESALLYFSQTLGLYVAFSLAVDRTVSFLKPVFYKYLKAVFITYPLVVAAWGLSIMETVIMLILGTGNDDFANEIMISCGTASCWSVNSYFATLYSHLFISIFVVVLNFALMFIAKRLMKQALQRKAKRNLTTEEKRLSSQNHFQMKVIKTLSVMVISHATSHITSRVILLVLLTMHRHDPELTVLGSCARNLVVINAALHFFFYYATSSEMRSAVNQTMSKYCCRCCCSASNRVLAATNSIFNNHNNDRASPGGNFLATTSASKGAGGTAFDGETTILKRTAVGGDTATISKTAGTVNDKSRGRSKVDPLSHLNVENLDARR